ncbi:hypothetical protein B0H19DRAFT_575492 [Mycena capillaripes]|nr:hypothetical protein B0H19DRAFT_575492 [Mycena capillaripes]
MPLTRCPDDVSIDILAYLSLNTIVALTLVQKAWKTFIETYEEHIYHNAAIFDGLVLSSTTSLAEEKWALGSSLWIDGWKAFCRLRIDIERNWAGLGSSSMDKISTTGNSVVYRKAIPGTDRAIVSSMSRGIAVYDENGTVWALPDYYIPQPTYFVYDAGHLVFQRAGSNIIDIWHDGSHHTWLPISLAFLPSPEQGGAHTTSSVNYFPGYFHPAAALPAPSERINTIKLLYPTLVVATSSAVHIWDIQAANSICTLGTQNIADLEMRYQGVEISQELIVAFDSEQIRFFSRHDGLFLSFLSRSISISARGAQLLPPPNHATPSQWPDRVLLQQILFRKRRQWSSSRGRFTHVGVSPCGMTLCILSSKLRMLIVNDIQRVIKEDLPISDAAVDVKIAGKYGSFNSLTVTRDRIAIEWHRNPHHNA